MPKTIGTGALKRARDLASQGSEDENQLDPRLDGLKIVPIRQIRPGFFQSRLVEDQAKDDLLRKRMQADLNNHKIPRHAFAVVVDPDDSAFYNPKMGGHRRLKIAQELGVTEVCVWVDEYDAVELARGTYTENDPATRQDLNIVEEGRFFQRAQEKLDWTQTEIAERFDVDGGQPHVSRCIQAASYPPDLQHMLFKDPDRGMRAAVILFQLEALGKEEAVRAREPLIAAFLAENPKDRLSTDALQIAVNRKLGKSPSANGRSAPEAEAPLSVQNIRRLERVSGVGKSLERFRKEIGTEPPTGEERHQLQALQEQINELLARE